MPFLTAISNFISKDWREEKNHHQLIETVALKTEEHLSPQQELMLLLRAAQYGKYEEAVKFYNSLLNFRQAPYANIICAQIMLAMSDSSEKKLLADALNLSVSFLSAAIEEFNQTPENERQSWPYLITSAEIQMRRGEINFAEKTLEPLINQKFFSNRSDRNYLFSTILLLAKIYLHKFVSLKNNYREIKDELISSGNKLGFLIAHLKNMQLDTERKEILPALAALECEFLILSAEGKIVHLSMIHANVALEMHDIYKSDATFHLRDYLLDDTTRHRMEGIFQLTYAMESLFQKQQEIEQGFVHQTKRKSKRRETEIYAELKNINEILSRNLAGLLNGNEYSIKNFIVALDLSNFRGGTLITLHYKNIFKNILLALVLLGVGYLAPVTA